MGLEPYSQGADKLDFTLFTASIKGAIERPSLYAKVFGRQAILIDFRNALPAYERAFERLKYVPVSDLRAKAKAAHTERQELKKALEIWIKADPDAERRRRSDERRRYEKARLAAIDDKTRNGVGAYRELVDFTGSCAYCESKISRGVNAHLDHIMRVAKGGLNRVDNLVWACDRCNLLKCDKSFYRFLQAAKLHPDKVNS